MQRAFGCRTCTVNYHQLVNSVAIWAEIQSFQSVYPNLHSTCTLLGGHGGVSAAEPDPGDWHFPQSRKPEDGCDRRW